MRVPRYPSDMTDAEWELLRPQAQAVMAELRRSPAGKPMEHDLRAVLDAIGYVIRYGIEWRALPVDFLVGGGVRLFPSVERTRLATEAGGPAARAVLHTLVWADGGYAGRLVSWAHQVLALTVTIITRSDDTTGFAVLPRRWVVERTFGWLLRYRRLVRDYERRAEHHEAMVLWATAAIMTRKLARTTSGGPPHPPMGTTPHRSVPARSTSSLTIYQQALSIANTSTGSWATGPRRSIYPLAA